MAENKKLFLDYTGLTALWEKMKSTFAGKAATEQEFGSIKGSINTINSTLGTLDAELDTIDANLAASTPKEAANYSAALALANSLVPGTIINVKGAETIDGAMYVGGFYIVDGKSPASIKYLGTTSGNADDDKVAALENRVETLEGAVVKGAMYTDGTTSGNYTVTDNQLVIRYDDTYVANSQSVNALTHKAIAAKFGELESMLTSIPKFKITVVDSLPVSDISASTIYLVKNTDTTSNNLYTEYIYIDSAWEKLGEQTLDVTNFLTAAQVEQILAGKSYATTGDLTSAVNTAKSDVLGTVEATYVKSAGLEDLILTSITEGKIGAGMAIPVSDIEKLS